MSDETINLNDIIAILRRNFVLIVGTIFLTTAVAGILAVYLPKQYKSKAVLNIQSSYFRNPLVSDLVADGGDPSELNAQRQSLLRMALTDDFLNALGEKFNVFKYPRSNPLRTTEREFFLKGIEYFSVTPTTFQISVGSQEPTVAYEMTSAVLNQMTRTLIEEKYRTLIKARDAIQTQAQFLSRTLRELNSPGAAMQADHLQSELELLDANIGALRQKFTENHPDLMGMKSRAQSLRNMLKNSPEQKVDAESQAASAFMGPNSKGTLQDIYNDLLKKLSNLGIVLAMEKDRENVSYLAVIEQPTIPTRPYFPEKRIFLLCGFFAGLVFSGLQIAYVELKRSAFFTASRGSDSLGLPLLGELPALVERQKLLLLESPRSATVKALPLKS